MKSKKWFVKFLGSFCGTVMGSCLLLGAVNQPLSMEYKQTKATTYNTELAVTETVAPEAVLEEKSLLYSTDLKYGEGCLFITINKDMARNEENPLEDSLVEGATISPEVSLVPEEKRFSMENTGVLSSNALMNACLTEQEKAELLSGMNKEIRVTFHIATEAEITSEEVALMMASLEQYEKEKPGISFGNYVRITFEKKNTMGEWESLNQLYNDVTLYLDVPADFQTVTGTLWMLQVKEGESSLHKDQDNYKELLTFVTSGSSIYGLCCEEEVEEVVITPEPTQPPTYWEKLNSDELCVWHWFALSISIIGITWVWAINRKRIRMIFLVLMSLILIGITFMGSCIWDWPLCGLLILFMLGLHVSKIIKGKKKK